MSCISDITPPVCHDDGYDQDEVIRYFKECSDRIRPLYIKAGWETATELWDEIDKTLKANGEPGDTFDVPKRFKAAAGLSPYYDYLGAADCFHAGQWQVICDDPDGIYSDWDESCSPDEWMEKYVELDKYIAKFVAKATEFLAALKAETRTSK